MTIRTQVIWNLPTPEATIALLDTKALELTQEGKEIGVAERIPGPETEQATFIRTWVDEAAATEWIDFVKTFNPASASILD
jgi:hypothetical protein